MEKQQHHQPPLRLLPHSFKYIGRGVILLGIIIMSITHKVDFGKYNIVRAKVLLDLLFIGSLLCAFAKEKIEDELLMLIRLQSAAYTFIIVVLYAMLMPIVVFMTKGRDFDVEGLQVILISLLAYSSIFEFKKRRM